MRKPNKVMETSEVYRNVHKLLNPKKKKKVKVVEPGMKFTPTDGEYAGKWHEVDYEIGGNSKVWDCLYKGKPGQYSPFPESDILRWINS